MNDVEKNACLFMVWSGKSDDYDEFTCNLDGWMDGWIDGWMDGWRDGWFIEYKHCSLCRLNYAYIYMLKMLIKYFT